MFYVPTKYVQKVEILTRRILVWGNASLDAVLAL